MGSLLRNVTFTFDHLSLPRRPTLDQVHTDSLISITYSTTPPPTLLFLNQEIQKQKFLQVCYLTHITHGAKPIDFYNLSEIIDCTVSQLVAPDVLWQ